MKRIKIYARLLLTGIIILIMAGCEKFLDERSDKRLTVPETLDDAQMLLDYYVSMNGGYPNMGAESDDDFYMADNYYNTLTVPFQLTYRWDKDAYNDMAWSNAYKVILQANVSLETLDKIGNSPAAASRKPAIRAHALFVKATAFYFLAQYFALPYDAAKANVLPGIPLRNASDLSVPVTRANMEETYSVILDNLQQSVRQLPDTTSYPSRPTKPAAYALMAKVYLTMHDYDKAALYADSSLRLKNNLVNYNTISTTAATPFLQFNAEVVLPLSVAGAARFNSNNYTVDSVLYGTYDVNDLRRIIFFKSNGAGLGYSFKGNYEGNTFGQLFCGIATDEVYLMKAECEARKGNTAVAMTTLNALLEKRWKTGLFVPLTAANAADALQVILKERRKELVGRGIRWMDLRRLNTDPLFATTLQRKINGTVYTLPPNHPNYTFYIPPAAVDISGLQQNERQ